MRIRRSLPGNKIAKPTDQLISCRLLSLFGLLLALVSQGCANGYNYQEFPVSLQTPAIVWPGYCQTCSITLTISPARYQHWQNALAAKLRLAFSNHNPALRLAMPSESGDLHIYCRLGPITVREQWQSVPQISFAANLANRPRHTIIRQHHLCWNLPIQLQINDRLGQRVLAQRQISLKRSYILSEAPAPLVVVTAALEKWLAEIFSPRLQLKRVRLYRHPLVDKIKPSLASGNLERACAGLSRSIDFFLVLQQRQQLTAAQWRQLEVAYHTRGILLDLLECHDPAQRDQRCADAIRSFLRQQGQSKALKAGE